MSDQELLDLNLTDDVAQDIAAMTFAQAQPYSIKFVRRLTRKLIATKAVPRDIMDLQDPVLNSPAEMTAIADLRTAFIDFETAANSATNKGQLGVAWGQYKIDVGLV